MQDKAVLTSIQLAAKPGAVKWGYEIDSAPLTPHRIPPSLQRDVAMSRSNYTSYLVPTLFLSLSLSKTVPTPSTSLTVV
jgi:hypothetical protein